MAEGRQMFPVLTYFGASRLRRVSAQALVSAFRDASPKVFVRFQLGIIPLHNGKYNKKDGTLPFPMYF